MKNCKHILIVLTFCFVFSPIYKVYAECTKDEKTQYTKLAKNIRVSYNYLEDYVDINNNKQNNFFNLTITNLPKEIIISTDPVYIFKNETEEQYININSNPIEGDTNIRLSYYTSDSTNCPYTLLKVEKINLPVYNEYSTDELCKGIEDFKYCNKLISTKITYEGFKKNVLKYKEKIKDAEAEEIIEEKKTENNILKYIKNNIYILITITLVLLTIISIIIFKINKRGRNRSIWKNS